MKYFFLRSPFAFSEPSKRTTKSQNSYLLSPTLTNYYSITSVSGFQVYPHNNMASQQQQQSAMVLYIPYTYGENDGRKGVTEKQVFWHMRNLNVGFIDHIDCKQRTDKTGTHIRSWFVHFSTWTAPHNLHLILNDGGHLEVTYDDYGHYWKIFKYTPKPKRKESTFRIVPKAPKTPKTPPPPLTDEQMGVAFPETKELLAEARSPKTPPAPVRYRSVFSVLADSDPNDPDDVPAMKCICEDDSCKKA